MASLLLGGFTLAVAVVGPRILRDARWARQAPPWGIRAWQALTVTVVVGVVLTGLTLAVPVLDEFIGLAEFAGVTPAALTAHYGNPGGQVLGVVALVATLALVGWLLANTIVTFARGRIVRRRQLRGLALAGRPHPDGYVVLDSSTPSVYCLPGRRGVVVVTSSAKDLLEPGSLSLVLAHEHAHLESHHHRIVAMSACLRRAFSTVPPFRTAHQQIELLVEMQADDRAVSSGGRQDLAKALATLCFGAPRPGLGAGGHETVERITRLARLNTPPRWRSHHTLLFIGTSLLLLVMPVVLAVAPAVEAAATHCCS